MKILESNLYSRFVHTQYPLHCITEFDDNDTKIKIRNSFLVINNLLLFFLKHVKQATNVLLCCSAASPSFKTHDENSKD